MSEIILPILHFNDVYNMTTSDVSDQKVIRGDKLTHDNFDHVVRFSDKINEIRNGWAEGPGNVQQGLLLFSGDLFSPSVESMLTRGRNMVHLMNELAPDACVPGNHEFDFGRERFNELTEFSNFNWILSNVKECPAGKDLCKDTTAQGSILGGLREYCVFERAGLRIGIIGLMSKDALKSTNKMARADLRPGPDSADDLMISTSLELSRKLRNSKNEGGEECDLVIALTHAEHSEDIDLGRAVCAYPSTKRPDLGDLDGVDVIFGGHNHKYFLGAGVELQKDGSQGDEYSDKFKDKDDGLLIVKSGYDFQDLSEVKLVLEDGPKGSKRKKVVKSLTVTRHRMFGPSSNETTGGDGSKKEHTEVKKTQKSPMENVLRRQFQNEILSGLDSPIARLSEAHTLENEAVRKQETDVGDWIADTILKAYNEMGFCKEDFEPSIFIMTGGSIRSKGFPEGVIRSRHIIGLLPFQSPLVTLELTGENIVGALEAALAKSGTKGADQAKEEKKTQAGTENAKKEGSGSFPVFSGIHVEWDSMAPAGRRVKEVRIPPTPKDGDVKNWPELIPTDKYRVLTNSFLADAGDGFESFKTKNRYDGAEIPMYQLLHLYIETKYTLDKILEDWDRKLDGTDSDDTLKGMEEKIQKFVAVFLDINDSDADFYSFSKLMKRAVAALYGPEPEAFLPELGINQVDGRLNNKSQL